MLSYGLTGRILCTKPVLLYQYFDRRVSLLRKGNMVNLSISGLEGFTAQPLARN